MYLNKEFIETLLTHRSDLLQKISAIDDVIKMYDPSHGSTYVEFVPKEIRRERLDTLDGVIIEILKEFGPRLKCKKIKHELKNKEIKLNSYTQLHGRLNYLIKKGRVLAEVSEPTKKTASKLYSINKKYKLCQPK